MSNVNIVAIDYDPPGRDAQGEYLVIRNADTTPLDMLGWTLRDSAPIRPHIYTFKQLILEPGGSVRVWTKSGSDTPSDVYLNRGRAVWNNPGDTAILSDASGVEISRFLSVPLPSGASPMRLAVPAFWTLAAQYIPHWDGVKRAGPVVGITVIEGSWPATAASNATWRDQEARPMLNSLPGVVLGYISTRNSGAGPLRSDTDIMNQINAWYTQFGQQIDGIYFDELVLPEYSDQVAAALQKIDLFKASYPSGKVMILAGQCIDEAVVGANIDWALLWEGRQAPYVNLFRPLVNDPAAPGRMIPAWWKNPRHRSKIVHVIHACGEPERQHTLGLALERNAGHVFVMDLRGVNPGTGNNELYDHLPPYWDIEVRDVDSYYDFGFDPLRALRAAHRYGLSKGKLHAWPNFEAAWYPSGHVRGTFLLDHNADAMRIDVPQANLPDNPSLFDIPALCQSAHKYATQQGHKTAIPTFDHDPAGSGINVPLIVFRQSTSWLNPMQIQVTATYQQPTFAEPGAVFRNVNRVVGGGGNIASFPTFVPDHPTEITGRRNFYNCYAFANTAPVTWEDVPTSVYISQL